MAEKYERNRNAFIALIVFGLFFIPASFALQNTVAGWGGVAAVSSFGFMFFVSGILGLILILEITSKEKINRKNYSRLVQLCDCLI